MAEREDSKYSLDPIDAWRNVLQVALIQLAPAAHEGKAPIELAAEVTAGRAIAELQEARRELRSLFEQLGLEWPGDQLHLADVIDKHLRRAVMDRAVR
jgi:hypothetical protein